MSKQNKQNGLATIAIILLMVVGLGAIAGVFWYLRSRQAQGELFQARVSPPVADSRTPQGRLDGLSTTTPEALIIGEQVVVRGTQNQDGSITASMIYVGSPEEGFGGIPGFAPGSTTTRERPSATERPSFLEGIDPEEFRTLSPEERMQRMQELRGNSNIPMRERGAAIEGEQAPYGTGGAGRRQSGDGFARGEIIARDEMSITVKLVDGGSKLVFHSHTTQIMEIGRAQ